jgi:hypothetical protein
VPYANPDDLYDELREAQRARDTAYETGNYWHQQWVAEHEAHEATAQRLADAQAMNELLEKDLKGWRDMAVAEGG